MLLLHDLLRLQLALMLPASAAAATYSAVATYGFPVAAGVAAGIVVDCCSCSCSGCSCCVLSY
eukprot:11985745-Alexandrium_andersonii.AAC.1